MKKTVENAFELEKELTRIYKRLNEHFWNNELPEVIITFVPTKNCYGHMTKEPVWVSSSGTNKYELNISSYTLNRPPEKICETMLHEQCHLYCNINNIKDTSNAGRYHNGRFKQIAEEHGLTVLPKNDYYGWCDTTLSEKSKEYILSLKLIPISYHHTDSRPQKNTLTRLQCPVCGKTVVWVSSSQNVLCGECKNVLIYTPSKKS